MFDLMASLSKCGRIFHPSGYYLVYIETKSGEVTIQKEGHTNRKRIPATFGTAKNRNQALATARTWLDHIGL